MKVGRALQTVTAMVMGILLPMVMLMVRRTVMGTEMVHQTVTEMEMLTVLPTGIVMLMVMGTVM
jgi:hypothetical protein